MSLRQLIMITSMVLTISGLVFLIAPVPFLAISGIHLDSGTAYLARLFGLAFIGTGILSWLIRDSQDRNTLRAYSIAALVQTGIGLLVCLQAAMVGTVNIFGWTNIIIYGFFTIGYGYHLLVKKV